MVYRLMKVLLKEQDSKNLSKVEDKEDKGEGIGTETPSKEDKEKKMEFRSGCKAGE